MSDAITTLLIAATQTLEDDIARKKMELASEEQKLDQARRAVDAHDTHVKTLEHSSIFEATFPCDVYFVCGGKPRKFRGRAQWLYDRTAYAWFEDGERMVVERDEVIRVSECTRIKNCPRGDNHRGRCAMLSKLIRKS